MAHFAKIESGIVTQVVVVDNEHENYGQEYLNSLGLDGTWLQTSYNGNTRGKYAGIGDTYDAELDEFVAPYVEPVAVATEETATEPAVVEPAVVA
jgi:hypothetical protein